MLLSEIKGEAAIDTLVNLIDPVSEILADPDVKDAIIKKKAKISIAKEIVKKHKKDIVEILAILNQQTYEEYVSEATLGTILMGTMAMLSDKELENFLDSQVKSMELNASGLHMESTEEKENQSHLSDTL